MIPCISFSLFRGLLPTVGRFSFHFLYFLFSFSRTTPYCRALGAAGFCTLTEIWPWQVGTKADVWALGGVLAAMAAGSLGNLDWIETRPLDDGIQAFDDLLEGRTGAAKIILHPASD